MSIIIIASSLAKVKHRSREIFFLELQIYIVQWSIGQSAILFRDRLKNTGEKGYLYVSSLDLIKMKFSNVTLHLLRV